MKKVIACILGILAIASSSRAADQKPVAAAKPNIIVILTDDQGYGDFSCTGNPILKTPNMDRLAHEGVNFRNFHVSPTCSPTRSALMSGRHEFLNGVTHTIWERERMSLKTITIAQVLKDAGYTTGIFGKWHLGDEDAYQPDRRGFDEVFIHGGGGIGQTFPGSGGDAPGNTYFSPVIRHNGTFEKTQGYCTDVFFGQAKKWIESVKGKKPFFVYLPTNAPHVPLQVRPEDEARYAQRVPKDVAKYFGMIANIDDNFGRLLAKLKEWGIADSTLIVLMNDNGGTGGLKVFNAGMSGHKGDAWEGGTRAASFWYWPGTLKPSAPEQLTAHLDVFPTLAELAGVKLGGKVRAQVEGRSLVPLLKNPQAPWPDRYLFTHVGRWGGTRPGAAPEKFGSCSVRNTRYSIVRGKRGWQLYDLGNDIGQRHDIAAEHPEVVKNMAAAYDRWWGALLPHLENEEAYKTAPKINPFKEAYGKQFGGRPSAPASETDARLKWWREARFGMFIHWDVSSLAGTEISWSRKATKPLDIYGDKAGYVEDPAYDNLYKRFNPVNFDAAKWVRLAKDSGMKYIVFTAKHHGGFCMWDTKLTDYSIMHTPFQRDVVRELADACHKAGIRFGLYYSPRDWHHPDYGIGDNRKYHEYIKGQLAELLGNYGKVDVVWFDSYGKGDSIKYWHADEIMTLVKRLQPQIVINNRCSYFAEHIESLKGDFDTPEQRLGEFQNTRPWESCMCLVSAPGGGWSYRPDGHVKPYADCLKTLLGCATGDGNLLLDVGPDSTGVIPADQAGRLLEMGAWLKQHGDSIYGTRGGPYRNGAWGGATYKDNTIYLHVARWNGDRLQLPPLKARIVKCNAAFEQTRNAVTFTVPASRQDKIDTVVTVQLDAPAGNEFNNGRPIEVHVAGPGAAVKKATGKRAR